MLPKVSWSLSSINMMRERIDTNPDYQRPYVWTTTQKQLLMDTIIRDYDIPKLYLNQKSDKEYDVIDGQQRIRAIWDFYDDKYPLAKDSEPVDGKNIANKKFSELDTDTQMVINMYNLDMVLIKGWSEDEIRDMFLRLQNGTTLKAQEKRNAISSNMRDYVKTISQHKLFEKVDFENKRFSYDHVAAQLCLMTINGGICNIKDRDLNKMYYDYKDFKSDSDTAKKVKSVLNYLDSMFDGKTHELKRYNVISLFALVQDLRDNYNISERAKEIGNWFIDFEYRRALDMEKNEDDQNPRLVSYHEKTSHSTDSADSIQYRHNVLKEDLMEHVSHLEMKDPKRNFDDNQRQVIFRRNKGVCQICGKTCEWNNWEADHIVPWSKGGKTDIENGQVLCPDCNSKKGNNEQ